MDSVAGLLPIILVVVVFYFFILRPARTQQQKVRQVQQSLAPGLRVVTSAGLHATVVAVRDAEVEVETIPPGTRLTFERRAVVRVVDAEPGSLDEPTPPAQGPGTSG
jgi:preprotein translocase subunit YajC